jgi:hypothetical protein
MVSLVIHPHVDIQTTVVELYVKANKQSGVKSAMMEVVGSKAEANPYPPKDPENARTAL